MLASPKTTYQPICSMAGTEPKEVARLVFQDSNRPHVASFCAVLAHEQLQVGRRLVQAALGIEDRCISKHHLRIHCVQFEDDDEHVAPMIWVSVLSSNATVLHRHGLDDANGGILINRDHGAFLLNDGDSMQLTKNVLIRFELPDHGHTSNPPALDLSQRAEISIFAHRYRLTKRVLGMGGYATVYVANDEKTRKQLACKIVKQPAHLAPNDPRRQGGKRNRSTIAREFNILKRLSHPNIITLEAVFSTPYNVYIFQDLITGGDLMSYIQKMGRLGEPHAAIILRQLMEAVKYMHDNQIVHRDIKPENILMTNWRDGGRIVLTDFGQARNFVELETAVNKAGVVRMQTIVGTVGYLAPEALCLRDQAPEVCGGYSKAIDIWAVGCVACAMLGNDVLFPDGWPHGMASLSVEEYDSRMIAFRSDPEWAHIGPRAKDFIKGCLEWDEDDRCTAAEALSCEWFTHRYYRAEMDAAYKRAIADWQPRVDEGENLVEEVDTTRRVQLAEQQAETRSKHFPAAPVQHRSSDHSQTSQIARFRPMEEALHASPLEPESPSQALLDRDNTAGDSMSVPFPPSFDDGYSQGYRYGDAGMDFNDKNGLEPRSREYGAGRARESICSVPAPPSLSRGSRARFAEHDCF